MEINRIFQTIDTHTGGEPLRIITGLVPHIPGKTMLAKRQYFVENLDHIRRSLMLEPRGHSGMYGCILTEAVTEDADFGVLFMHNEGLSTMCGHGIIGIITAIYETGLLNLKRDLTKNKILIDTPAGLVTAYANVDEGKLKSVSFENVPSFVFLNKVPLHVKGVSITVDIVFSGAFYIIVNSEQLGLKVSKSNINQLKKIATDIKQTFEKEVEVVHPYDDGLKGIYGVIFSDNPELENSDLKNITIFADEQIDRSPCGTGTCGRLTLLHHNGEIKVGESFVHESIIGSQFSAKVLRTCQVGKYNGVIPLLTGTAAVTSMNQFVIDPTDPLAAGFSIN